MLIVKDNPSVINSYVEALTTAVKSQGITEDALFDGLEIDRKNLAITGARLDINSMTRLWLRAVSLTKDEHLGLHVGQQIRLGAYNILGSLILNSKTISIALEQLIHYQFLVSEGGEFSIENNNSTCFIRYQPTTTNQLDLPVSRYQIEGVLCGIIKFLFNFLPVTSAPSQLIPMFAPLEINFEHIASQNTTIYEDFFCCPVVFSAPSNGILFSHEFLSFSIPHADEELFLHHKQLAEKKLSLITKANSWQNKVIKIITDTENWFDLSPIFIAEKLNLSLRKMQRLLHSEGTNYQKLLDTMRKKKTVDLLVKGYASQAVAEQLAYKDLTSFHRACKRWFNMTPKIIVEKSKY